MSSCTAGENPGTPDSGLRWIKSSLSFSNSNCVQVARLPDGQVGVRDSKNPQGPVLRFTTGRMARIPRRSATRRIRQPASP
jgi:hypothetical protein